MIKGMLVYTPPGYNPANTTKKYPVIVYFHGRGSMSNGTAPNLCRIFSADQKSLPFRVETGNVIPQVYWGGVTHQYIIVAPQYLYYNYPTLYATATHVEQVLNFLDTAYRIDRKRVYLTGMSTGANMVMEYASSSPTRAQRVAAINMASLCTTVGKVPNDTLAPKRVANANLPVRIVHCANDKVCLKSIPETWVTKINNTVPKPNPLAVLHLIANCLGPNNHDAWPYNYDPAYRIGAKNLLEWFIMYQRATLPSTMHDGPDLVETAVERTKHNILVSPNPFVNEVRAHVNLDKAQHVRLWLTDISGRVVMSSNKFYKEGEAKINLNTAQLAKGMYMMKIEGDEFSEVRKLIKQ
jgi:dienelactone hydrolase